MNQQEESIRRSEVEAAFAGVGFIQDGLLFWYFPEGSVVYRGNAPDKGDRYLWLGQKHTALYYASEDTSLIYQYRTLKSTTLLVMNEANLTELQRRHPKVKFAINHVTGLGLMQQQSYLRYQPDSILYKRRAAAFMEIHVSNFFNQENREDDVYANARLALQLHTILPSVDGWIYPYKLHPEADAPLFENLLDPEIMFWKAQSKGLVIIESATPAIEVDE